MTTRFTVRLALAVAGALALQLPAAAMAQVSREGAAERTIRVSGAGEVEVAPDEARLSFAVETFAETARAAGAENARIMDRVIDALMAAGVPRDEMETRNYALHPDYVHEEGRREPRLRGYRATNQVVLTTRALDRVGELIDVALAAGANRMDGISFRATDTSEAHAEALRRAVANARASAEAIAGAIGEPLGAVQTVTASGMAVPGVQYRARADMEMAAPAAPPTPIQPGEQTVRAHVSVVYFIGGGM